MKLKTALILFLSFFTLFAQETEFSKPDYNSIERNIKDKNSEFYYPVLIEKFVKHDTLITAEQYHHLYYGFVFDDSYNPYGRFSKDKELNELLGKEKLTNEEIQSVVSLADRALTENPFDMEMLNILSIFKDMIGDHEESKQIAVNLIGLIRAIVESGNGKECQTAYHVISPRDEYAVMGIMGISSLGQSLIGSCDLQRLDEEKYGISRLFFDISKPFKKLSDSFK